MTSSLAIDAVLADTIHALAELPRHPPDTAYLRARLAAMDAALSAFQSALDHPLADLTPDVHRAFLAAVTVARALDAFPPTELTGLRRTTFRLLDILEALATPADRALRARLLNDRPLAAQPAALA